ncbi:uncharacterized protein LAESUDRAFT_652262, partial [Laetiporus sulphureus 93-53]
ALVLYDYLLTIGDEYHYIWKARLSFSCILFYACRYSAALDCIVTVWSMASFATWSTPTVTFAALRVYEIYNGSKSVFALVLLMSLVNPILTLVSRLNVTRRYFL